MHFLVVMGDVLNCRKGDAVCVLAATQQKLMSALVRCCPVTECLCVGAGVGVWGSLCVCVCVCGVCLGCVGVCVCCSVTECLCVGEFVCVFVVCVWVVWVYVGLCVCCSVTVGCLVQSEGRLRKLHQTRMVQFCTLEQCNFFCPAVR